MSNKATCPGCDSETSKIYAALERGKPCPYCGLPADVIVVVQEARVRHADEQLLTRLVEAEKRAAAAEKEAVRLRRMQDAVRRALDDNYYPLDFD